jgi:hypothetical protein
MKITGQVIYCGPTIPHLGLQMGGIFSNGIHPEQQRAVDECPALGELFVTPAKRAAVRRELNLDIARNMRGTSGNYVTFFRQVQKWLASKPATSRTAATTIRS